MSPRQIDSRRCSHRLAVFSAVVAVVVALTGLEASAHGHVPAVDGWHGVTPHGDTAHDSGLSSCSICRLAHETSSAPATPGAVSEPLPIIAPCAEEISTLDPVTPVCEHSPRAPPCLASC